ncbi:hypothetical protein QJQ45_028515, partial [Haematococcus lacustris]
TCSSRVGQAKPVYHLILLLVSGTRARQLAYARSLASRQSGSSAAHPRNKATPIAAGSEAGTCSHIGSALPSPPSSPPAEELDARFPALITPNPSLAAHAPKSSLPAPPTSAQRATSTNARSGSGPLARRKLMTASNGGGLLLLGLGWLVSQPLVAQARVLLALGWQRSLVWPVAQLQRPPPALPNALHALHGMGAFHLHYCLTPVTGLYRGQRPPSPPHLLPETQPVSVPCRELPASTKSSAHTSPATTPRKLQPIRVEQQVRHQVEDSSTSGQCVSAQSESGGQPENHYSSWGGSSEGSSLGDNAAGSSRKPLTSHLLLPCPSLLPDMMLYTGALSPSRSSTPTSARTALRRSAAPPSPSSLSASCKPAEKQVPPSGFTPAPGPAQYQGSLRCDSPDLLPHLSHTSEPTALPGAPGTHRLEEDDGVLVCSFGGAELGAGCCSLPHQPYPWADGLASDNTDASSTSPTPGDTCAHRVAEDTALKAFQDHNAHSNNSASIDTAAGDMKGGSEAGALPRHQSTTAAFDMLQASMGHGFVVMTRAGQSPRAGRVVPTTDAPAPVSAGWVRPTLSATHPPAAELLPTYPRGIQGMSGSGLGSTSARALTTPRNGTPPSAGSWRAGGGASDFRTPRTQCRGSSQSGLGAGCSAGGGGDGEVQTPGSVQSNTAWQISPEVERRPPLDLVSPGGAGSARGTGSGSKSAADPRMLAAQLRVKEHSMAAVSTQLVLMLAQLAHQTQTTQSAQRIQAEEHSAMLSRIADAHAQLAAKDNEIQHLQSELAETAVLMEGFDGDVRSTVNCLVSRVKELEQQVACLQTTEIALRQQLSCVEQEAHVRASQDGRLRKEQEQRMCEAEEAKPSSPSCRIHAEATTLSVNNPYSHSQAELEHRLAWEQEQHQATKARSHEAEQLASDATAAAHEYAARLLTLQAALEQQQAEHARQLARLALGMSTPPGGPPASASSTPGAMTHALLAAGQGLHSLQTTLQQQSQLIDKLQQHSVVQAAHCQQLQLRCDTMDVECCQLQLQPASSSRVRQDPGGNAANGPPRSASSPGGGTANHALASPQPHAPAVLDALPVKSHCLPPGAWSSSPGSSANTPSPPTKGCPLACPPPSSVMLPNLPDSTQIVGNSRCNEPEVPFQVSLAQPSSATPAPRPAAMAGTSPFARAAAQGSNGPTPPPEIRPLDNQAVCQAAHPPAVLSTSLISPQRQNPPRHAEAETAGSL